MGRNANYTVKISAWGPTELRDELDRAAQRHNTDRSHLIREALYQHLNHLDALEAQRTEQPPPKRKDEGSTPSEGTEPPEGFPEVGPPPDPIAAINNQLDRDAAAIISVYARTQKLAERIEHLGTLIADTTNTLSERLDNHYRDLKTNLTGLDRLVTQQHNRLTELDRLGDRISYLEEAFDRLDTPNRLRHAEPIPKDPNG